MLPIQLPLLIALALPPPQFLPEAPDSAFLTGPVSRATGPVSRADSLLESARSALDRGRPWQASRLSPTQALHHE